VKVSCDNRKPDPERARPADKKVSQDVHGAVSSGHHPDHLRQRCVGAQQESGRMYRSGSSIPIQYRTTNQPAELISI